MCMYMRVPLQYITLPTLAGTCSKAAIPYVYSLTIRDCDHMLMGPIFTFVLLLFFAYFVLVQLVCKSYE
jgi:hypothetical protein